MFSMQGVGYLAVPVVAYALVGLFGNDDDGSSSSDMAWRLLLGTGSLPGFALIITRLYRRKRESLTQQHPQKKRKQRNVRLQPTSMLQQIHHEHKLRSKLIGTAGTWLLCDVLFYGNALFQPKVLRSAFGPSETELDLIRDTILIGLLGLPGKQNDEIGSLYIFFSVREIDLSTTQYTKILLFYFRSQRADTCRLPNQYIFGWKTKSSEDTTTGLLVHGCTVCLHWLQLRLIG
jgi:MFS family permease